MKLKLTISILVVLALSGGTAWYLIESSHSNNSDTAAAKIESDQSAKRTPHEPETAQTTIPADIARREGVVSEAAGALNMQETVSVYGSAKLNSNRIARAVPRFGGMVRKADKSLGESVSAGDIVAVVETNQSLTNIEVRAPISGVIVDRDVTAGETVADGAALYTIADLSDVWIDLNVPKRDQARIKVGQKAVIHADDGGTDAIGTLAWISPISSPEAQTLIARVILPNSEQRWRPGLYVKAEITVSEAPVKVAVKETALQSLNGETVVFSVLGDVYKARSIKLGRRGSGYAEVTEGLEPGEHYVTGNSFLIKADIGKSSASDED